MGTRGTVGSAHPTKEIAIFDGGGISPVGETLKTGVTPGQGTYFCLTCGEQLSLHEPEPLPECPRCGRSAFRRDSIFADRRDHGITVEVPLPAPAGQPRWVEEVRRSLAAAGCFLAFRDDSARTRAVRIEKGWTRIGRSANADVVLDDPSVSRRHAMIVAEPGKDPRVLDDRSLNGILVNGRPVEWETIGDGDELAIGRFRLYLLLT